MTQAVFETTYIVSCGYPSRFTEYSEGSLLEFNRDRLGDFPNEESAIEFAVQEYTDILGGGRYKNPVSVAIHVVKRETYRGGKFEESTIAAAKFDAKKRRPILINHLSGETTDLSKLHQI